MRRFLVAFSVLAITLTLTPTNTSFAGANVRLTNDSAAAGGYVSEYTLATGVPYTDAVITECNRSRGRQNEPSVAVDPRNTQVILGSSNDYCAVFQGETNPTATGPIWLGYYRSENSGTSFRSSLVPGYPADNSPYAALAQIRTASSGDPVIAWDGHGRAFFGSESSDDPAGSKKTFGDVWVATFDNPAGTSGASINDGKRFVGSTIVERGSSAPNLLGKFNDKTAIEADRTGGSCDATVYFVWSRFTGNGGVAIYLSRSTDHGATWSTPKKLSSASDVQFPDIAVAGNGNVYVTWRTFARRKHDVDSIEYAKSTDCGATFAPSAQVATFVPNDAVDIADPQAIPPQIAPDDPFGEEAPAASSLARDCGDFASHCQSGYTFFRRDTQIRSTADQSDTAHEYIYLVYDATKGAQVPTGTSYGTNGPGTAGQAAIFFRRLNGATGGVTGATLIDSQTAGHQVFPDISADQGNLFAIWWDSRSDPTYDIRRPIGNSATGATTASLDVFSATSTNAGTTWTKSAAPLTSVRTNPNYEQFANRTVPFAGDYLWVSSIGGFAFTTWTDWRDTVGGLDPREGTTDTDHDGADVHQCRTFINGAWTPDRCPRLGGLDQNIYGSTVP